MLFRSAKDVTRPEVLADVAEQLGISRVEFANAFASQEMRDMTAADFAQSLAWGIRGFPTVVAQHGDHLHLVGSGYMPIDALRERIAAAATPHHH